jgi:DNA excision repair protein ERCC-4
LKKKRLPMVVIRDTREQNGYDFACITPSPEVKVATLATGDYSLEGLEDRITIERKSLSDAFGTFGQGRGRFERELERMSVMQYAAVVIEADWDTIVRRPPARSRLLPKTVVASINAWSQRYRIHFWTCPNREFAERYTFRLLERFWKDRGLP